MTICLPTLQRQARNQDCVNVLTGSHMPASCTQWLVASVKANLPGCRTAVSLAERIGAGSSLELSCPALHLHTLHT